MTPAITVAVGDYDRMHPLVTGQVGIASADLNVTTMTTGPMLASAGRAQFDVTEHSLASYLISLERADPHYIAIPVFPSRMFRHNAVYVHRDAGLRQPEDLVGARIGIQAWHITAMVWIRGIFADEHGVALDSVSYVLAGMDSPGAAPSISTPPAGVRVEPAPEGSTLVDLLRTGEIDAIYAPGAPSGFGHPGSSIRRLLEDPVGYERSYFQRTRLFPLMHVVVLRRDLVADHPDLAGELLVAFDQAKQIAQHNVAETAEVHSMDPWAYAHAESTRAMMGDDFWPYGLEPNRGELYTFLRYAFEQGLTRRLWSPDELFVPAATAIEASA